MPVSPPRPCNFPGCRAVTHAARCDVHTKQVRAEVDGRRAKTAERGYGSKWRTARAVFLSAHPLCAECERNGFVTAATVVDHIVPHRGDDKLFWSRSNWQALCASCHSRKTAIEDGRWGRGVKSSQPSPP